MSTPDTTYTRSDSPVVLEHHGAGHEVCCNFCTTREGVVFRLTSSDPVRRTAVGMCVDCAVTVLDVLSDAVDENYNDVDNPQETP